MGGPLASAVIITYNQEKYIEQTIKCALAQKVDFGYEIVIGEDCSTDNTRKICLNYQEKYPDVVRVITSDTNVGLIDNWYRSVRAARGKYIAGCGGDDYWHNPDKIRKQVIFVEENQDYGMVHSENDFFFQKQLILKKNYHSARGFHREQNSKYLLDYIISGNYPITASTALFRKELFEKYFNLPEIKKNQFLMEDTPFWIEIAAHAKIFYFNESLATYRVLENSVSRNRSLRRELCFKKSSAEMRIFYCKKYNMPKQITRFQEKNWRRVSLQLALYDKQPDLAKLVKNKFKSLSIKEKIWYWGATIPLLRPVILLLKAIQQIPANLNPQ